MQEVAEFLCSVAVHSSGSPRYGNSEQGTKSTFFLLTPHRFPPKCWERGEKGWLISECNLNLKHESVCPVERHEVDSIQLSLELMLPDNTA